MGGHTVHRELTEGGELTARSEELTEGGELTARSEELTQREIRRACVREQIRAADM